MVSEHLINRFDKTFTELAEISGGKEHTGIVTNLEVIDAAPGITGFIIVEDSKDGDYITAATIPGMIYANGDLVNVLFIDGTEPIAYQHGSGSSGVAFAVDRVYRPDFTATVLTGDNSNDVTLTAGDLIIPDDIIHSGDTDTLRSFTDDAIADQAGGIIMLRMTETAQDLVEIGDVAGGGDVDVNFNSGQVFIQGSDGKVGIGTNTPDELLEIASATAARLQVTETSTPVEVQLKVSTSTGFVGTSTNHDFAIRANDTNLIMLDAANGRVGIGTDTPDELLEVSGSGTVRFQVTSTDTPTEVQFKISTSSGFIGTSTNHDFYLQSNNVNRFLLDTNGLIRMSPNVVSAPSGQLHVDQSSTTAAIPTLYLDQADISEEMIEFNTTIGVGNAIEAVGAKTLTTTHFIKVTLPGALTRYIPCGTIA